MIWHYYYIVISIRLLHWLPWAPCKPTACQCEVKGGDNNQTWVDCMHGWVCACPQECCCFTDSCCYRSLKTTGAKQKAHSSTSLSSDTATTTTTPPSTAASPTAVPKPSSTAAFSISDTATAATSISDTATAATYTSDTATAASFISGTATAAASVPSPSTAAATTATIITPGLLTAAPTDSRWAQAVCAWCWRVSTHPVYEWLVSFVGCLTSQQHASVSQGQICSIWHAATLR